MNAFTFKRSEDIYTQFTRTSSRYRNVVNTVLFTSRKLISSTHHAIYNNGIYDFLHCLYFNSLLSDSIAVIELTLTGRLNQLIESTTSDLVPHWLLLQLVYY